MKYTQKKNKQKIKRKNRISRRKIMGGGLSEWLHAIQSSNIRNISIWDVGFRWAKDTGCLNYMSNIASILPLVFKCDIQYESLFEYDDGMAEEGENGYQLTMGELGDDGYPKYLNKNLIQALKQEADIFISVVSSGGHSGLCIIFVLENNVHCITYGVNIYKDKETGSAMIAIRSPETSLISPLYSIIIWEKFTEIHWNNIMAIYNTSFFIKKRDDENVVLTVMPYSMFSIGAHNCQTFAVEHIAIGDSSIVGQSYIKFFKDTLLSVQQLKQTPNNGTLDTITCVFNHAIDFCSRSVRNWFQVFMPAPNQYFNICIEPVVDLIVLAVKMKCYKGDLPESGDPTEDDLRTKLQSVMRYRSVRRSDDDATYDRIYSPYVTAKIEYAILLLRSKLHHKSAIDPELDEAKENLEKLESVVEIAEKGRKMKRKLKRRKTPKIGLSVSASTQSNITPLKTVFGKLLKKSDL